MSLLGSQLGPYQIVASIGAGGMGEVYRARDTRLDRDVAIKVLPPGFAHDPDRRARFDREAKAIAALSHPNILAIFDTGEHTGQLFVVTELLEGDTLRQRLTTAAIPTRKAIDIAIQIARGLAAAHEKGLVHRDLKPENVFLTNDGHVKILDFGLARQVATNSGATETVAAVTDPGTVMGTVGYMAPEQVRGLPVDGRADLFALGAVLYETLSGRRAFRGETGADTMIAIIKEEPPDLAATRADLSPAIDRVVRHCLEKNQAERFQTARDVVFALESITSATTSVSSAAPISRPRAGMQVVPWAVAIVAVVVAAASVWLRPSPGATGDQSPILTTIPMPVWLWPELSPDGRHIASGGIIDGRPVVRVRSMDSLEVRTLVGTDNANGFFWFPDSQSLGVLSVGGRMQRFFRSGDAPQLLREGLGGNFVGATVNLDGTMLFTNGKAEGPLLRMALSGGETSAITALDSARDERAHVWPQFLPDGRRFLFTRLSSRPGASGLYLGSLDSKETTLLVTTDMRARYVPGYLLFVAGNTLMAQPFDTQTGTLSGVAKPLANTIDTYAICGCAGFTTSMTGLVGYVDAGALAIHNSRLAWLNRDGLETGQFADPGDYVGVNLSRDDRRIALSLMDPTSKSADIWIGDVERNQKQPLLATPATEYDPEWASLTDGRIFFSSDQAGPNGVFAKSTTSSLPATPIASSVEPIYVSDVSSDDAYVIYQTGDGQRVFYIPMKPAIGTPVKYLDSPSMKDQERFSPDTKWVAYNGSYSGRFEVYVTAFPNAGEPLQVSTAGGVQPRWTRNGAEIVYLAFDGSMMSVAVSHPTPASIRFGQPVKLFGTQLSDPSPGWEQYDVTRDGQRFLVITPPGDRLVGLNLRINWQGKIK